jgi:xylan 1,4-beta-xylosidase
VNIRLTNSALPRHPVKTEAVRLLLNNAISIKGAYIERIDDTHANATGAWEAMGKPGYLSATQVAQLETVSSLTREALTITPDNGALRLDIDIPPQGSALITLETA